MARTPSSFNRFKPRFKPQPTILVICEDSKSGLRYLKDVSRYFRVEVKVEVLHCGHTDPRGIVEQAIARQKKFDYVYCVIDRDSHPNFDEAIELAKTSDKVVVRASYPCFEFWLLLHFKYSRKPYKVVGSKSAADALIKDLRQCPGMEAYNKGDEQNIFESLLGDKFDFARRTASQILAEAIAVGEPNPSTMIHLLIDEIEKLSKPQLLE